MTTDKTMEILRREALLKLGIGWEDAVDNCSTIEEIETLLILAVGVKPGMKNVWDDGKVHQTKVHNSVRFVRQHWYDVHA